MVTIPKERVAIELSLAGVDDAGAEPPGAIRLRLAALGVDFRAADFPAIRLTGDEGSFILYRVRIRILAVS